MEEREKRQETGEGSTKEEICTGREETETEKGREIEQEGRVEKRHTG